MKNETVELVTNLIGKLEAIAPKTWEIMVHGQLVGGWVALCFGVLLSSAAAYCLRTCYQTKDDYLLPMFGLFAFILVLASSITLSSGLQLLLAPEYYALKELGGF